MSNRPILSALHVAQEANATAYRRAAQGSSPGECWDFLVLTATNEKQADGYRQELSLRTRPVGPTGSFFPAFQKSVVVADPPGPRIGSGGATLNVLRTLVRDHNLDPANLPNLRILLIHSGGLSQRLPAYSPVGKIFAPLPLLRPDGQIATLFDHLYVTLAGLPDRLGPGMLVLAGDVFILFDHRHVSTPHAGVTALTFRVDPDIAAAHGVFVTDPQSNIQKTLQKVSPDQMRIEGASDAQGKVLIDTGLLFFDPKRTQTLASLAGIPIRNPQSAIRNVKPAIHEKYNQPLDLYVDVVTAMTTPAARTLPPMQRDLHKSLKNTPFKAMTLDGEFLHLGTTRQFRDAMIGRSTSPVAELLQQNVLAHGADHIPPTSRAYHSALLPAASQSAIRNPQSAISPGALIESTILAPGSAIGSGSVLSQVFTGTTPITLSEDLLLFQVPVRPDPTHILYVQILCGVDDDFKGKFATGECRFLNAPLQRWLDLHDLSASDLWPKSIPAAGRTLWTARLFPVTADRSDAASVLWFQSLKKVSAAAKQRWLRSPRYSMAMILADADPAAMIEHREIVTALAQAGSLLDSIQRDEDRPVDDFLLHYASPASYAHATSRLLTFASTPATSPTHALQQSRALWYISQLSRRPTHPAPNRPLSDDTATRAFSKIAAASEQAHSSQQATRHTPHPLLPPGKTITATSPVRLDLTGGWSDTPPYCYERGGHVINLAIDLDSRPPIRATVRTLKDPLFILDSHDLGKRAEFKTIDPQVDVHDPFALHKLALQLVGLSARPKNVGLEITTECRLPKGSGLGTSSILAATLLAALNKLVGQKLSPAKLIEQTLLLEQRLSTGGGWQDQVGGILPGIKSVTTSPGLPQIPSIETLKLPASTLKAFEQRLVVYYTGQQRLARDILRRVMARWLSREPAMTVLMDDLKRSAQSLRTALLKSRWPAVAAEINRYWSIKKELYPGSTTPAVDVLFLDLRHLYLAAGLAGAGGGGFAYFFCKDPAQAKRLTAALADRSSRPGSLGAVYPATLNPHGLVVKVS